MQTQTTTENKRTTGPDSDLTAKVQMGTQALDRGDLDTALSCFEDVVLAFPDRPEGHNNLGALYTSLASFEKAETCFDRVIELLPDNANVLYNRGVVRTRLEKFDAACDDFEKVLELHPGDIDAHNNLGVTAFLRGNFDEAHKHLTAALAQAPDHANALINLCDVEWAAGKRSQAIERCEAYLACYQHPEVRRRHFEMLRDNCRGALAKASQAAEAVLAVDREDTETRQELGRLLEASQALNSEAAAKANSA